MKCEVSNSTYYSSEDFVNYLETIEKVSKTYFSQHNLRHYDLKEIKSIYLGYSKNLGLRVKMVKDEIWIRVPYKNNLYASDLERVAAANQDTIPAKLFEDFPLYLLPNLIEDHSKVTYHAKISKYEVITRINDEIQAPTVRILKKADSIELKNARHASMLQKEKDLNERLKCQLSIISYHQNSMARAEHVVSEIQEKINKLKMQLEKI